MDNKRPLILISNDDGYNYKGIQTLIKVARTMGDVFVVAPAIHQSGMSSAITFANPVRTKLVTREQGYTVYLTNGTPADGVKLALSQLMDRLPDLVLAGINHGSNHGMNTLYSGTLGCVFEGTQRNIPSVAFSYCDHSADADVAKCVPIVEHVVKRVLEKGLPSGICLNVNIPKMDGPFKGMKVTEGDMGRWLNDWQHGVDPTGGDYYWLTGKFEMADKGRHVTDYYWLEEGYVTVTPTRVDQTAFDMKEKIADLLL